LAPAQTKNQLLALAAVKRMKTEIPSAPAAPGNQSVRQLAATLTKTAPAPSQPNTESEAPASPETPEPEPNHEPAPEPEPPVSLTTVEGETPETPETEPEPTAETPEPEPEPEPEPTAKPLAKELLEAIEIAKAQDGGKGKADLLKRVAKVVDQRDTERNARLQAEEQNAQLRMELQQARENKPAAQVPAGMHPEVAKVSQELATVDHWLGWCEEQLPRLQSGEIETVEAPDGKGGKLEVGLKDLAKTKRDLENMRQEVVARKVQAEQAVKAAFDAAYKQSHAAALTAFPQLKDPNSDFARRAQQFINAVPGLKQFPDHELVTGAFFQWLDQQEKPKPAVPLIRKAAPSREPTRVSTTPPGSGADPTPEGEKKVKASTQQFQKSGSTRDLARTLTASRQASRIAKR
jgi:hypothetical protein